MWRIAYQVINGASSNYWRKWFLRTILGLVIAANRMSKVLNVAVARNLQFLLSWHSWLVLHYFKVFPFDINIGDIESLLDVLLREVCNIFVLCESESAVRTVSILDWRILVQRVEGDDYWSLLALLVGNIVLVADSSALFTLKVLIA